MKKILLLLVSGLLIACMAGSAMADSITILSDAPTTEDGRSIELLPGSTNYLSTQFAGYGTAGTNYIYASSAQIQEPTETTLRTADSDEVTISFVRPYFFASSADYVDEGVVIVTLGPEEKVPVNSKIVVTVIGADDSSCSITISAVQRITTVPEFPTVALPVAAILGLVFIFGRKKDGL